MSIVKRCDYCSDDFPVANQEDITSITLPHVGYGGKFTTESAHQKDICWRCFQAVIEILERKGVKEHANH